MTKATRSETTKPSDRLGARVKPSGLLALASYLPLPILHALARTFATVALLSFKSRVKAIDGNLLNAFPELSASQRRRLVRAFVCNIADVAVETVKGYSMARDDLDRRVRITNSEVLDRFARANQSIIVLGSHEANWEWVLLSCSGRMPFSVEAAYKPPNNRRFHAFLRVMRTRFGASLFAPEQAGRAIREGRSTLRAIVLTVDEKPSTNDQCHWVRFLGQDTAFRSSFATLAKQWKYPVVFASRRRTSRGHYEVTFEILGEPPYEQTPVQLVARYVEALERSIIRNPADWLWTQRRWAIEKPFYE